MTTLEFLLFFFFCRYALTAKRWLLGSSEEDDMKYERALLSLIVSKHANIYAYLLIIIKNMIVINYRGILKNGTLLNKEENGRRKYCRIST